MKPISEVVACVVDHGLFVPIAQCLAEKCKQVFYVGPQAAVMPRLADAAIGDGFENVTRIQSVWEVNRMCDLVVYPDIGFEAEQLELVRQKIPVWGHRGADRLEVLKGEFISELESLEMDVPPHTKIKGLERLREYLRDTEDVYIKISRFRGDWETFHWRSWVLDESALDCAAYRLGPAKEHITFYVFEAIDTDIEDGIDTWCIDGRWPKKVLHAIEKKDKSLLGAIQNMSDISEQVRGVNEKFGPVLAKYGYRGAFSTEVRIAGDKSYFNDPSCRFGSPPSQLQTALIKNLPEVIWAGANGEVVEPESPEIFGAQVLVTADREKEEWLTFDMPDQLRPYIKSSFACEIDGVLRIAPNPLENWAGWLVATGNSIEDVVNTLKERKAMLPAGFECDITSLSDLLRELESAKAEGVEISDQPIPAPETVLEES